MKKSFEQTMLEYFEKAPLTTAKVMKDLILCKVAAREPTQLVAKTKHMSPEARKKISEAAKKRWAPKPIQKIPLPEAGD